MHGLTPIDFRLNPLKGIKFNMIFIEHVPVQDEKVGLLFIEYGGGKKMYNAIIGKC